MSPRWWIRASSRQSTTKGFSNASANRKIDTDESGALRANDATFGKVIIRVVSRLASIQSKGHLLSDHPHIDGREPLPPSAQHDRVEFCVGDMITVSREDVRQAHHSSNQRRGIARRLSTHPLDNFVAFKFFEHRPCLTLWHR